jgi:hypothetical protein
MARKLPPPSSQLRITSYELRIKKRNSNTTVIDLIPFISSSPFSPGRRDSPFPYIHVFPSFLKRGELCLVGPERGELLPIPTGRDLIVGFFLVPINRDLIIILFLYQQLTERSLSCNNPYPSPSSSAFPEILSVDNSLNAGQNCSSTACKTTYVQ